MTLRYATALRTTRMDAVKTAIDAGAGPGTIAIYTGAQPASPATAPSGTRLATLTMTDPCGSVVTGVLTASAITEDSAADAAGDAGWFRISDSTGAAVLDGKAGLAADVPELTFTGSKTCAIGQPVRITSLVLTEGNA